MTQKSEFFYTNILWQLLLTEVTLENNCILTEVNISNVLSIFWDL